MSKVLKISKHQLDLAKLELTSPSMLIGRSPLCDQILRAPGIRPVQFLLEWIGEGEFDPNEGMWTLFDMGHLFSNESLALEDLSGEGILLNSDQRLQGLNFEIVEDRIMASNIQKGVLSSQIKESVATHSVIPKTKLAIEVVILEKEEQKVKEIFHFFDRKFSTHQYNSELPFAVIWKKIDLAQVHFAIKPKAIFDLKGQKINHKDMVDLGVNDSYIMHFEEDIIFVRFVNRVKYEVVAESLIKNKFILSTLVSFGIFAFLLLGLKSTHNEPLEKERPPERLVKIVEIAPPPPVIEKQAPEVEVKKEEVAVLPKEEVPQPPVEKIDPPKLVEMEKIELPKKVEKAKPAMKAALKPKVVEKVTDVNSVGLLSKIKPTKSLPKQVSEETISKSITLEKNNLNENKGVVVQTNQAGIVAHSKSNNGKNANNSAADSSNLEGVETQLKGAKEFTSKDTAPIAKTNGLSETGSIGNSLGKSNKGSSKIITSIGGDGGEISGGLTKNQVSEVINAHRREIRTCYESALLIRNDLNGIMRLSFGINLAGNVTEVKVVNNELNSNILESCIVQVIKAMKFPESSNQAPTTVIYPFVFKRSS